MLCESRRQSNAAQRFELEGTNSLHGSIRESSPFITKHRKLDNTPLYINNNDSEAVEGDEEFRKISGFGCDDHEDFKIRPQAIVRPRKLLSSINSSSEEIGKNQRFTSQDTLIKILYFPYFF